MEQVNLTTPEPTWGSTPTSNHHQTWLTYKAVM